MMERYFELWNQAVDETRDTPDERGDGLQAWRRHYELCQEHGIECYPPPDDEPIYDGAVFVSDLRFEDRETRIASGEPQWQAGGGV